ncbi:uncharacterized protein TNCV_3076731 [Trichonephila clavipes]|nr:uncharacterized protein TNCV_3076731 [Trichonephila clavipes]
MIQKELNIGSAAKHKIIHEELHMKKVVCRLFPHYLIEHQKEECVRISKVTIKLLNGGGHHLISKTDDETNIPFFDIPTRQESKIWVFKIDPTPTMVKRQRATKKVMYAVFLRSTGLIKAIKLEGQKTVTANAYITKCLPEILQEVDVRGRMLQHVHSTGLTVKILRQKQIEVIEHPPYSPDLAMSINLLFSSVPRNEWFEAFNKGKIHPQEDNDVGGDYFEHS